MSLVLTRRPGQSIRIGSDITVTIVQQKRSGRAVLVSVDAPKEVRVLRGELDRKAQANA